MRCFVTGATGHVGSALVRRLLSEGCTVAIAARDPGNLRLLEDSRQDLTILRFDRGCTAEFRRELADFAPRTAFHLAWGGVGAQSRNAPEFLTSNVSIHMGILDAIREAGCERFVGVGSQAEYGNVAGRISEETPENPLTGYGVAKLACSKLSRKFCETAGMEWVWVRLFATFGPGDDPGHLLPFLVGKMLAGDAPALTLCEQRWDYLYVDDAAEALAKLGRPGAAQGLFNLGSGRAVVLRDLVQLVASQAGFQGAVPYGAVPYRPDQQMHLEAEIGRLESAIDWRPRHTLQEGVAKLLRWHRESQPVVAHG